MFEVKFKREDILVSPLVYSTVIRRDGSEVYEIHKNRINGKRGIVDYVEFNSIKSQITNFIGE